MKFECIGVSKHFGSLTALDDISFAIDGPIIKGLIGPNGSGKTVLLNVISKIPYGPDGGEIVFDGQHIEKMKPAEICKLGIARTFQTPVLFPSLTVEQNLLVGLNSVGAGHDTLQEAISIAGLCEKRDVKGSQLSILESKNLMIATALSLNPKLVLLDEPLGGLSEGESIKTIEMIRRINETGRGVLVIEHKLRELVGLCSELLVFHLGKKIVEGVPAEVVKEEQVLSAYFGEEIHAES